MNRENLKNGILGGLVGGVVFGMMMAMMGMLPMIGKMVGQPNAVAGFAVHLFISAGIGAAFALFLGPFVQSNSRGAVLGTFYGALWWVLGPLTMMPLMMGMGLGVNWNLAAATKMMPSLMGHLIFGVLLGLSYARLTVSRSRFRRRVVAVNDAVS